MGAAHAHFELAGGGHQFELDARDRNADHAGTIDGKMRGGGKRRRLGRAPGGRHRDAAPGRAQCDRFEPVPKILRQRGCGIEDELQPREEVFRQGLVVFEMRQQRAVARRDVEIDRGRDLAQIAHRLADQRGHRLAAVDVERPGVAEHEIEIVIAAEGVVPGQPVEQHELAGFEKSPDLPQCLLVGGEHAVRIDDGLGRPGRAGREQKFGDCSRAGARHRGFDRRARLAARKLGKCGHLRQVRAVLARRDLDAGKRERRERLGERRRVRDIDEPRLEQARNLAQLGVILTLQRISDRDRRHRDAGRESGKHQNRMLQRVPGQDHQRALRGKPAIDQRLGHAIDLHLRFRIGQPAPAVVVALGEEQLLRRPLDRAPEHPRETGIVRFELAPRPQQEAAAGKLFANHFDRSELDLRLAPRILLPSV